MLHKVVFVLFSLLFFAGCSTFFGKDGLLRGKGNDYLEAGSIEEINVPDDMESKPLGTLYPIPYVLATDEFGDEISLEEYDVPRPVSRKSEKIEVGVKIQRVGDDQWIYLNAPPGQIWPRTQNYFSQKSISVTRTNVLQGLIETAPFPYAGVASGVKLRVFVTKGIHPDTTEVHLIQAYEQVGDWPEQSVDKEIETRIVRELAESLALNVNNKSASLLGQNIGGEVKAGFAKRVGEPTMKLLLPKKRVVAVLNKSLENSDFKTWGKAEDNHIYYVGFLPEDEKSRFYTRMIGMGKSLPNKPRYSLDKVLQHLSSSDDVKALFSDFDSASHDSDLEKAYGFLLVLRKIRDSEYHLVVRDVRGERIPIERAKEMLSLIRKNLA